MGTVRTAKGSEMSTQGYAITIEVADTEHLPAILRVRHMLKIMKRQFEIRCTGITEQTPAAEMTPDVAMGSTTATRLPSTPLDVESSWGQR